MEVLAIIPARSGSKTIPHKNVRYFGGHPLLAWSIAAARACPNITRTLLSTDSAEYADIGRHYGAYVPFLRPAAISGDSASDREFILHALNWLEEFESYIPDIIVLLRPTTPLREPDVLARAIAAFIASDATSLCTGFEMPESPVKNFRLNEDGTFSGFWGDEWLGKPRQECPKAYVWDGVADIFRAPYICSHTSLYGPRRMAWITQPNIEIDTPEEWEYAEMALARGQGKTLRQLLAKREQ